MPTIKEDISNLQSDVRLIQLDQKYTKAGVARIEKAINKMAYVSKGEYAKDQGLLTKKLEDIDGKISALEEVNKENAPNQWFNSEARKFVLMGIGIVISALIGFFLTKVGIK